MEIRDWVVKWLGHRLSRLFVSEWEEGGGRRQFLLISTLLTVTVFTNDRLFLIYFMSEIIPFVV